MAVYCPNCGAKQASTARIVTVLQTRQDGTTMPEVDIQVFECPTCKMIFSQDVTPQTAKSQNPNSWTALTERLEKVQLGLKQNLENLRQNLSFLETECSDVLFELETIRKDSESKAIGLEEDVNRLREEIHDLKNALGLSNQTD